MVINTGISNPEVSVILTLYNSRKYFFNAVNSVMNQTFKDLELIIVDDGSSDETEADLFHLLKKNDNFKYIRHSNRKHPLSLNTGLRISIGNYITFLDSDDEYLPDHLSLRVNFLNENSDVDLLYSPAVLIGEENEFYVPDAIDKSKLIHLDECVIGGTLFGRKTVFTELGGFRNIYSHDSDFVMRAKNKFNVRYFDNRTYIYNRINPDSITNQLRKNLK